jgi:hypothetical protein
VQDDDREQPGRGLQIESRNALRKVADDSHRANYYGEHLLGYSERKQMNGAPRPIFTPEEGLKRA